MATKNCPHCSNQVPVACKKCVCGHTFFATRRGALQKKTEAKKDSISPAKSGSKSPPLSEDALEESIAASSSRGSSLIPDDFDIYPRRTTRIQREKPNFYDALEYETQMRKQKMLTRRGVKSKSDDTLLKQNAADNSGSGGSFDDSVPLSNRESKSDGPEPKKRRGRPPGLTGKNKVVGRARIQFNSKSKATANGRIQADPNEKEVKTPEDYDDIMNDITPEKALQYNIVLQEINRKWIQVGWKM